VELGSFQEDSNTEDGKDIVSYTRPHDIEIRLEPDGKEFIGSEITFIRAIGPVVRIELKRLDNGEYIQAEISKETYKKLELKTRQTVYIRPKDFKVFIPEDYVI